MRGKELASILEKRGGRSEIGAMIGIGRGGGRFAAEWQQRKGERSCAERGDEGLKEVL